MTVHELISSPAGFEIVLLMISFFAGIIGAILGLGGGVIMVPTLTLIFGINIRYAIGASLISVIATSSGAAASYVRDHITNVRVAMLLEVATTLGALGGVLLTPFLPTEALYFLFSAVLFYSAAMMLRKRDGRDRPGPHDPLADKLNLHSSYPDRALGREVRYRVSRVKEGFALMFGAGVISSLLGVGSGSLKVPAMDLAMNLPIKVSSATSNFMIGVTAAASATVYYMRGEILPLLAAPVALGVLAGSWIGARLMMRMHARQVRWMFALVIAFIALQMAIKAFRLSPGGGA